eukprot:TRINITY_DN15659_c0_g1_i1.p1 TRINITY_DN15659_c0_g1~~TRINITY_DN15659_c0_g1_i1.p1  ORF type:complete len:657 (+),score=255.44 TRINITY_DN15659_c0_g1_i1:34-1971(+)
MHKFLFRLTLITLIFHKTVEAAGSGFKVTPILGATFFGIAAVGAFVLYYLTSKKPQIKNEPQNSREASTPNLTTNQTSTESTQPKSPVKPNTEEKKIQVPEVSLSQSAKRNEEASEKLKLEEERRKQEQERETKLKKKEEERKIIEEEKKLRQKEEKMREDEEKQREEEKRKKEEEERLNKKREAEEVGRLEEEKRKSEEEERRRKEEKIREDQQRRREEERRRKEEEERRREEERHREELERKEKERRRDEEERRLEEERRSELEKYEDEAIKLELAQKYEEERRQEEARKLEAKKFEEAERARKVEEERILEQQRKLEEEQRQEEERLALKKLKEERQLEEARRLERIEQEKRSEEERRIREEREEHERILLRKRQHEAEEALKRERESERDFHEIPTISIPNVIEPETSNHQEDDLPRSRGVRSNSASADAPPSLDFVDSLPSDHLAVPEFVGQKQRLKKKSGSHVQFDNVASPEKKAALHRRSPSFSDLPLPNLDPAHPSNQPTQSDDNDDSDYPSEPRERSHSASADAPPSLSILPSNSLGAKKQFFPTTPSQCATCKGSIFGTPIETPTGNKYHPRCFTCARCQQKIPAGKFFPYNHPPTTSQANIKVDWFLCERCNNSTKQPSRPAFLKRNNSEAEKK